jgi:hypothetical protein
VIPSSNVYVLVHRGARSCGMGPRCEDLCYFWFVLRRLGAQLVSFKDFARTSDSTCFFTLMIVVIL